MAQRICNLHIEIEQTKEKIEIQEASSLVLLLVAFLGSFSEEFFEAVIADALKRFSASRQGAMDSDTLRASETQSQHGTRNR